MIVPGNVVTTVRLFVAAAGILCMARRAFFILPLSLFFAYLLESVVAFAQRIRGGVMEIGLGRLDRCT